MGVEIWGTILLSLAVGAADEPTTATPLAEYFRHETTKLASLPLQGIESAEEWKRRRPVLQQHLKDMLGLWPEPARSDLSPEIRGIVEKPDFVIEKVLYQSRPGLYVTGNLYRPKVVNKPLPAILYLCGHARVEDQGVIYGNKAHYQHHAAWFASNGYVCLILDTLQLGEVPGVHHGTYNENRWWWVSRGYTPAGVEAWNAIRGLDYLSSRAEVDKARIGVTGRSGGGATAWWVGAIDDRVAAVCAVAGITDLTDHVINGVVDGHCDCMFFVNTHRWDFPTVAALVAPKPLLVLNTEKDPIFPEDGVRRIFSKLETVYEWYKSPQKVSLILGSGGHVDSELLRHSAFAFFEGELKGVPAPGINETDRRSTIKDLKVLAPGEVIAGSRNEMIDQDFVAKSNRQPVPLSEKDWREWRQSHLKIIESSVLAGWPSREDAGPLAVHQVADKTRGNVRLRVVDFLSQKGVSLKLWVYSRAGDAPLTSLSIRVIDQSMWTSEASFFERAILGDPSDPTTPTHTSSTIIGTESTETFAEGRPELPKTSKTLTIGEGSAIAYFAPRGIGPTSWPQGKDTSIRRRFMLLGQTLDSMRTYDIIRAVAAAKEIAALKNATISLEGGADSTTSVILAALFEGRVGRLRLVSPLDPTDQGAAFMNLTRFMDLPQVLGLLYPRDVTLIGAKLEDWKWAFDLGTAREPKVSWPEMMESH